MLKADSIAYHVLKFLLKAGEASIDFYIDFVRYKPYSRRPRTQSVYNTFRRLEKKGYLQSFKRNNKVQYRLFRPVRKELEEFENLNLKHSLPKQWDKRWRLVSFDIPEIQRKHRDALRWKLKRLGLGHFQHSVWLTPYPLIEIFYEIINRAGVKNCVKIIETDNLPEEEEWKKFFKLSK